MCLRPDDSNLSEELCRPVQSVQVDLEVNTYRNEWTNGVGSCANCNQFTVDVRKRQDFVFIYLFIFLEFYEVSESRQLDEWIEFGE